MRSRGRCLFSRELHRENPLCVGWREATGDDWIPASALPAIERRERRQELVNLAVAGALGAFLAWVATLVLR